MFTIHYDKTGKHARLYQGEVYLESYIGIQVKQYDDRCYIEDHDDGDGDRVYVDLPMAMTVIRFLHPKK